MASVEHLSDEPTLLPHLLEDSEQDFSESLDDSGKSDSDDSQKDPTFTEALSGLSWLSVRNKSSRTVKSEGSGKGRRRRLEEDFGEVDDTEWGNELNEVDQKSFEGVQALIAGGKLEKLKIDQCKVYLRKYELRLTGNKDTLIGRIREHIRILNCGGESEYPTSSFVLNCKGDACMGDIVLFEQRVYEKYDLASRSGPPIGTRVIAGRIIKESYGASKQQHTFTIEVLWSKGKKPLPPLNPLLIKGRNLYRMNTFRQRWEDETLREQALRDKHSRGKAARTDREMRILEKKLKKELREKRMPRTKNSNKDQFPFIQPAPMALQRNHNEKHPPVNRNQSPNQPDSAADRKDLESRNIVRTESSHFLPQRKSHVNPSMTNNIYAHDVRLQGPIPRGVETIHNQHIGSSHAAQSQRHHPDKGPPGMMVNHYGMTRYPLANQNYHSRPKSWENTGYRARNFSQPTCPSSGHHVREDHHHNNLVRQPCRYFGEGRCHFGNNCKFSHDS